MEQESKHLLEAKRLARIAHEGQKYAGLDYFEYHIEGVVSKMHFLFSDELSKDPLFRDKCEQVAYLHDSIEDSELTVYDLAQKEFSEDVIEAINIVTKNDTIVNGELKKYCLEYYLHDISLNKIARIVKTSDSFFNLENCIQQGRKKGIVKYSNYLKALYS
jgi:(p)ppGpp synthase/HD superfamily hydrolase